MKERTKVLFSIESLRWILRILLQLKFSSRCGGSATRNGGLWWPPVVLGGGEEGVRVWVVVVCVDIFHAKEHIYNLQISLSELVSISRSPLLALSPTFQA